MTFSREQTVGQTQRIGSIEDRTRVRRFLATAREKGAKRVSRCWNGHVGSVTRQVGESRLQDCVSLRYRGAHPSRRWANGRRRNIATGDCEMCQVVYELAQELV